MKKFKKSLLKKKHKRLSKREELKTKLLIADMISTVTSLFLDKLSQKHPDYQEVTNLLNKLQEHYTLRFLEELEDIIISNAHEIISSINVSYSSQGFAIYHSSKTTQDLIATQIQEHLELIKTIPQDIIQASRTTLSQALGSFDAHSVYKQLSHIGDVSSRRAELIARDQTAKTKEAYNRAHAQNLGVEYYTWITSRDERVSEGEGGHRYLDNRIYKYDTPTAIIDSYKTKGHPSQRVNCRCYSAPLIYYDKTKYDLVLKTDTKRGDYYELRQK